MIDISGQERQRLYREVRELEAPLAWIGLWLSGRLRKERRALYYPVCPNQRSQVPKPCGPERQAPAGP